MRNLKCVVFTANEVPRTLVDNNFVFDENTLLRNFASHPMKPWIEWGCEREMRYRCLSRVVSFYEAKFFWQEQQGLMISWHLTENNFRFSTWKEVSFSVLFCCGGQSAVFNVVVNVIFNTHVVTFKNRQGWPVGFTHFLNFFPFRDKKLSNETGEWKEVSKKETLSSSCMRFFDENNSW